ncbi:hypothetical protein AALB39_25705 [Lachnospiraceae bacterium 54-53]
MKKNSKDLLFGTVLALTLLGAAPAYASLTEGQNVTWDLDGTIELSDYEFSRDYYKEGVDYSLVKNEDGSWTVTLPENEHAYLGIKSSIPINLLEWNIASTTGLFLSNVTSAGISESKRRLAISSGIGDGGWETTIVAYPVTVIQIGQTRWNDVDYLNTHRGNDITIHVKVRMSDNGIFGNHKNAPVKGNPSWWWEDESKRFQVNIPREEFTRRFNHALQYDYNQIPTGYAPVTYSAELEQIARQRAEELLKEYRHTEAGFGKEYYEYSWFQGGRYSRTNNNGIELSSTDDHMFIPMLFDDDLWGEFCFDADSPAVMNRHIVMQNRWNGVPFSKPITEIGAARIQIGDCYGINVLLTR